MMRLRKCRLHLLSRRATGHSAPLAQRLIQNGRAESILTLGPNPGTNTVTVSVTGTQRTETFNAEGIRTPKTLEIFSGGDQEGAPGAGA